MESYPLKFEPILKRIIWGGSEICRFKKLAVKESGIGESWEISQVPGSVSIVANGSLAGKSLTELIEACPDELMGKKVHDYVSIPQWSDWKEQTILSKYIGWGFQFHNGLIGSGGRYRFAGS